MNTTDTQPSAGALRAADAILCERYDLDSWALPNASILKDMATIIDAETNTAELLAACKIIRQRLGEKCTKTCMLHKDSEALGAADSAIASAERSTG